jgi:chemotaxis protein MotB
VSYADFITLLFAFFVVMFATAQGDKSKAARVSESVKKALEQGQMSAVVSVLLGGAPADKGQGNAQLKGPGGAEKSTASEKRVAAELLPSLKFLTAELQKEIDDGKISISMEPRGLAVSFKEQALFASGDDVVGPAAMGSIRKVAVVINRLPNPVRLEGHTDSVPIHNIRFRSN